VASTHAIHIANPIVRFYEFGQPPGTDAVVLWQGPRESLDQHGANEPFSVLTGAAGLGGTTDPSGDRNHEFVRFVAPILSNGITLESQSIRELHLPYELETTAP